MQSNRPKTAFLFHCPKLIWSVFLFFAIHLGFSDSTYVMQKGSIGLALMTPQLIASQTRDLWMGAAMEEQFYRAGLFSKKFFIPPAYQLHSLLQNCFLDEADACLKQVGGSLGLKRIADISYERKGTDLVAQIRWVSIVSGDSDVQYTITRAADDPLAFIYSVVWSLYAEGGAVEPTIESSLKTKTSTSLEAYGAYVMGQRYLQQRDFRRVFYPLQRAIELDPTYTDPIALLAMSYYLLNKDEEAYTWLEKVPEETSPWQIELVRVRVLLRLGKTEAALKAIRRIKNIVPGNLADLEFVQGLYYQAVGSYTRGISYMIAAINLNPSVLDYYLVLGEQYMAHGEPSMALPYYQKLVSYSLGEPKYRLQYAIALRESQEYARSIAILNELLAQFPDYFPARINLGIAYYELGWLQKSRKAFETNINLKLDTLSSLLNLAVLEIRMGNIDEGRKVFKRILKLYPNSSSTLINLGLLETDYGNPAEAEKSFVKALEYNQADTSALLGLSRVYAHAGRDADEYALLHRVLEVDPENISALTRLADKAWSRKAFEEAINYLQDVIDLRPMAYRQRISLAKALMRIRETERAQTHLQYIEVNFSNSPEVQMELGNSYFDEGMYDRAILAVEPLLNVDPREKDYHLLLAKSYTQQIASGQSRRVDADKKALEHYMIALKLAPNYWETYFWMGRYQRIVMRNLKSAANFLDKADELAKKIRDHEKIKEEKGQLSLF